MNSKPVKISLIVAAVAIWGLIIFKLVSPKEDAYIPVLPIPVAQGEQVKASEQATELSLDFGSVFAVGSMKSIVQPTAPKTPAAQNKPSVKQERPVVRIKWPVIRYIGNVKSNSTGNEVALFNIAGQEHSLKVGEIAQELRLESMDGDSACFSRVDGRKCVGLK